MRLGSSEETYLAQAAPVPCILPEAGTLVGEDSGVRQLRAAWPNSFERAAKPSDICGPTRSARRPLRGRPASIVEGLSPPQQAP